MVKRIIAAVLFIAGTTIVAAPMIMRLGWLVSGAGLVLGMSIGVIAGVLWQLAGPLILAGQRTPSPAAQAPPPPPA